jgi:hypothetical protein
MIVGRLETTRRPQRFLRKFVPNESSVQAKNPDCVDIRALAEFQVAIERAAIGAIRRAAVDASEGDQARKQLTLT